MDWHVWLAYFVASWVIAVSPGSGAVLAMSRSAPGTVFSIQSLSQDENIPGKFLEQILLILRKGGLLLSKRGAGGGYQLTRAADRITLGEMLELMEGPLEILPGGGSTSPGLNSVFAQMRDEMRGWLSRITIADVLQLDQARGAVSFDI